MLGFVRRLFPSWTCILNNDDYSAPRIWYLCEVRFGIRKEQGVNGFIGVWVSGYLLLPARIWGRRKKVIYSTLGLLILLTANYRRYANARDTKLKTLNFTACGSVNLPRECRNECIKKLYELFVHQKLFLVTRKLFWKYFAINSFFKTIFRAFCILM